ncbi:hypothetical protein FRX31_017337 [Thalictrum thalictroides]|uniref:Uncharacterized protein n=1 Tax=Thalictrum thalictroides TaxID=46969 RepID=A0A7J6W6R2_THATH|nr:hypothetical protein FRX31_017337 [Thalictrum thalictroides]
MEKSSKIFGILVLLLVVSGLVVHTCEAQRDCIVGIPCRDNSGCTNCRGCTGICNSAQCQCRPRKFSVNHKESVHA